MLTVVMGIMYRPDGRFLIAQRPAHKMYGGLWEFPGGKLDSGETPEEALLREFAEELNVTITVDKPMPHYHYRNEQTLIRFLPFTGRLAHGPVTLLEHQQVAFITIDEIDNYPFAPPDYEVVDRLKRASTAAPS